jgi:putative transposase
MRRQLRVEYAGAMYHVMSRGDRQKDIYLDDLARKAIGVHCPAD